MKKPLLIMIAFVAVLAFFSFSSNPKAVNEEGGIKWMTWKEAQEAQKKKPKKIFVDVYTDWCGWCKRMDATTFSHPEIVKYVNANFYAVKFDAETQEVIQFKGKDYKFISQGMRGYNELAAYMLNGQLGYPTTVYFDEALNPISPFPGYKDAKSFETLLSFVASNSYKTSTLEKYQAEFKGKIQ